MKIILLIVMFTSILFAEQFVSIGYGKSELDYYGTQECYICNKQSKGLLLEYGYDEMDSYRCYIDVNLNDVTQGIGAMVEFAPRFNAIPDTIRNIVGIPSIYVGLGTGYNHIQVEGHSIWSPSFNFNSGVSFESGSYTYKLGIWLKYYNATSVNGHNYSLNNSTNSFIVQYSW